MIGGDDEMSRDIGKKLANARIEAGYTQQKLSEITDISRSYICDIENGRYNPSLNAIIQISSALNIDYNFLLKMTEIHDNSGQSA